MNIALGKCFVRIGKKSVSQADHQRLIPVLLRTAYIKKCNGRFLTSCHIFKINKHFCLPVLQPVYFRRTVFIKKAEIPLIHNRLGKVGQFTVRCGIEMVDIDPFRIINGCFIHIPVTLKD